MMRIAGYVLLAALALAAAGGAALGTLRHGAPQRFQSLDVTGVPWGKGLDLIDATGRRRTLADFRGKVVLLSFGYTSCPDACPTALALLAEAVKRVGAERVQGLFVTVDPRRDTPERLARYVAAFDPSFIGLYGDAAATARAAREFKIDYHADRPAADGSYAIEHSTQVYVLDPQGRIRLLVRPGAATPASIVHDVRSLLGE